MFVFFCNSIFSYFVGIQIASKLKAIEIFQYTYPFMVEVSEMIPLFIQEGVAYVWNSEDWLKLRSIHRICGSLIGSAPSFPRQNDFTGLPMALMSEEAALLVEKGICELYELPKLTDRPSEEEKQVIKECEKRVLVEQTEALKQKKIEQLSQKIDIILAGKRQKLLSKGITNVNLDKHTLLQEEISKLQDVAPAHVLVHLPTENYIPTEKSKVGVEALKPSILDKEDPTKYSVFKDFWDHNYYITSGSKFGSDFLVYPGDPVRFHAMYMVRCINRNTSFHPANLVAFGRLSVAVNKLAVIAYCDNLGQVEYQTLQWHDSING